MTRALAVVLLLSACGADDPLQLVLDIRESSERRLFGSVETLNLRAERDGKALVEETYPPTTTQVAVHGVPFGANTTFTLEGLTTSGDIIARGSTCPVDFEAPGAGGALRASLYFSPTNTFAATAGDPLSQRIDPLALTLPTGDILLSGGRVGGEVVSGSEVFSVPSSRFVASDSTLNQGRAGAEVVQVSGGVVLVVGGESGDGSAIADAEILRYDTGLYTPFSATALGKRTGHRALRLPDDTVLVTGGAEQEGGTPTASTVIIKLQGGSATAAAGVEMIDARRKHAAVVASGIPILIGGYGASGAPLASMEALRPQIAAGEVPSFSPVAQLRTARAEATATLLLDGTILVVGGAGDAAGTPLLDAELFNPITRLTEVKQLAIARRGHSATLLPDGRVLIVGGFGPDGAPLSSVEMFVPDAAAFVSERDLKTPRAGQRALTLCDGTVLVVGGGPGAELYAPPP